MFQMTQRITSENDAFPSFSKNSRLLALKGSFYIIRYDVYTHTLCKNL